MKDWGKRLQEKSRLNKLPDKKREIPMPKVEPIRVYQDNSALLKELLDNPRVEKISIKLDRVGDAESTSIEATLKEISDTIRNKIDKLP